MSKILIIEDDQIILQMYRDKFLHEKFLVDTASDGEEGCSKLQSFRPDVVLLDLLLPERNGFDVLKFWKNDPELNTIPIIVLTNAVIDGDDLLKNWGISSFLLKVNTTPDDVFTKVKELLPQPA